MNSYLLVMSVFDSADICFLDVSQNLVNIVTAIKARSLFVT